MPGFCAVFNCSYCADIEKDKSNYRFISIVKNNGKRLETFESEKGKVVKLKFSGNI